MTQLAATFRREIDALPEVFDFVEQFFSGRDEGGLRSTVDFVIEELFTNCVKYNPQGKSGVEIALSRDAGELQVRITDFDSHRFDIRSDAPVVDPDLPLQERTPGGLGVHLIRKLMDRVDYAYDNGVSTITLFKSL